MSFYVNFTIFFQNQWFFFYRNIISSIRNTNYNTLLFRNHKFSFSDFSETMSDLNKIPSTLSAPQLGDKALGLLPRSQSVFYIDSRAEGEASPQLGGSLRGLRGRRTRHSSGTTIQSFESGEFVFLVVKKKYFVCCVKYWKLCLLKCLGFKFDVSICEYRFFPLTKLLGFFSSVLQLT